MMIEGEITEMIAAVAMFGLVPVSDGVPANPMLVGSCIAKAGPVHLSKALFIENNAIELLDGEEPIRIEIDRQSVRIVFPKSDDKRIMIKNIGSSVARGDQPDADVFLKFALLDGKTFLYWRETYQHRVYRQGLFEINGHNLIPFCEGHGGVTVLR